MTVYLVFAFVCLYFALLCVPPIAKAIMHHDVYIPGVIAYISPLMWVGATFFLLRAFGVIGVFS